MSANRLKLNTNKTELVWTGSKYIVTFSSLGGYGSSLQLGCDRISVSPSVDD